MDEILFICTGNYYRSRFAEAYLNHLAKGQISFSRGFEVFASRNEGPISKYTIQFLSDLEIHDYDKGQSPVQLGESDLEKAGMIILMDKTEHLPMYSKYFPERSDDLVCWDFQDVQFKDPKEILPGIKREVERLFQVIDEKK